MGGTPDARRLRRPLRPCSWLAAGAGTGGLKRVLADPDPLAEDFDDEQMRARSPRLAAVHLPTE